VLCSDAYQYESYGQAGGDVAGYGSYGKYRVTVHMNIIVRDLMLLAAANSEYLSSGQVPKETLRIARWPFCCSSKWQQC